MNVKNISPGVYLKPNIPTLNLLNTYILVFKKVKISSIFDRNLKIGTMKHILLFIMLTTITACLLTSCKSKTTQSATSQSQMSQSQILEVDDILARADSLTGKTFTTEALCTHICAHGGGKIFLMGSDDTKTIRVEAGTKIGSFKPETVNNLVRITGKLVEQRMGSPGESPDCGETRYDRARMCIRTKSKGRSACQQHRRTDHQFPAKDCRPSSQRRQKLPVFLLH